MSSKVTLQGGNTYGTRRTRSDHPERRAGPGADAQPGRRGRAGAGARRLFGAGRGAGRDRGRAAPGRGRTAGVRVTGKQRAAKSLRPFVFVASGLPSGSAFFCQRDNCVLVMPRSESVGTVALLRPCRLMLVAAVAALAWLAAGSAGARKIVTYPSGRVAFAILERRFPRSNEPLVTASSSSSRRVSLPLGRVARSEAARWGETEPRALARLEWDPVNDRR